jgi:hypothetical protein
MDAFRHVFVISAEDGIGERFAQRHGDVERALLARKVERTARIGDLPDDRLDLPNVARDVDVEGDAWSAH